MKWLRLFIWGIPPLSFWAIWNYEKVIIQADDYCRGMESHQEGMRSYIEKHKLTMPPRELFYRPKIKARVIKL